MKDFRQLLVSEKAYDFAITIYQATADFPKEERYGLTSQLRRATVSIGANIAEACGRDTDGDFERFLQIAMDSAGEVDFLLLVSCGLKFLKAADYERLRKQLFEIKKMLASLIRRVHASRAGR